MPSVQEENEPGKPVQEHTYPTTGVQGSSDGPIFKVDQLSNFINVRARATWKHGPTTGEPEPITFEPDPILVLLLYRQLLVRHVRVPNRVAALRPPERDFVPKRSRNPAPENLLRRRTVPLTVYQPLPGEPQRPLHVLAGSVLGEGRVAGWHVGFTRRRGRWVRGVVVGGEVEGGLMGYWGGGGIAIGTLVAGGGGGVVVAGDGGGCRGVVPVAEEVEEGAEEGGEGEEVEFSEKLVWFLEYAILKENSKFCHYGEFFSFS